VDQIEEEDGLPDYNEQMAEGSPQVANMVAQEQQVQHMEQVQQQPQSMEQRVPNIKQEATYEENSSMPPSYETQQSAQLAQPTLVQVPHKAESPEPSNLVTKQQVQFQDNNNNSLDHNKENVSDRTPIVKSDLQTLSQQKAQAAQNNNINRPVISAVPTEPKVLNPGSGSPVRSAVPKKPTVVSNRDNAKKVENTSKYTTVSHDELAKLKDTIKSLELKLKTSQSTAVNTSNSSSIENNGLFWKSIIIIGVLMFIMGWMLSSLLCRC